MVDGRALHRLTFWEQNGDRWLRATYGQGQTVVHQGPGGVYRTVAVTGGASKRLRLAVLTNRYVNGLDWSPRGSRIAASVGGRRPGLVTMNLSGRRVVRITHRLDADPVWSPDGHLIAFTRLTAKKNDPYSYLTDVHVIDPRSGRLVRVTGDGISTAMDWSPDGRRILIVRQERTGDELWLVDAVGQNQVRIPFRPGGRVVSADWRP